MLLKPKEKVMQLRDYLHKHRIQKQEFAIKIGYCIPYLGRVCEFKRKPSERLAKAIEIATDGEVTAYEILNAKYEKVRARYT